jgi:hypothetical protein
MMAAGTMMQAFGQVQAGKAAQQAGDFNAGVDRNQAVAARGRAAFEARKQRDMTRKLLATQRAKFGVAGVGFEGSPLLVMEETAKEAELDARAIEYGGEMEAVGLESRALLSEWEGRTAKKAARTQAFTSLLGGASKMMGAYGAGTPMISGSSAGDVTRYNQLMRVK